MKLMRNSPSAKVVLFNLPVIVKVGKKLHSLVFVDSSRLEALTKSDAEKGTYRVSGTSSMLACLLDSVSNASSTEILLATLAVGSDMMFADITSSLHSHCPYGKMVTNSTRTPLISDVRAALNIFTIILYPLHFSNKKYFNNIINLIK